MGIIIITFPKWPLPNTLRSLKSSIDICENLNALDNEVLFNSAGCKLLDDAECPFESASR